MENELGKMIDVAQTRLPNVEAVKADEFRVPLFLNVSDKSKANPLGSPTLKEIVLVFRKQRTDAANSSLVWKYYCFCLNGEYRFLTNCSIV